MQLKEHIIMGAIVSVAAAPILGINSVFFWLASFLIDADHYLEFLYKNKFRDWNPKNMFKFFWAVWMNAKRKNFVDMQILHTAEFFIAVYFASAILKETVLGPILQAVFWGMIFHIAIDILFFIRIGVVFKRAFSITDYLIRKKLMIKKGVDPDEIFGEALKNISKE